MTNAYADAWRGRAGHRADARSTVSQATDRFDDIRHEVGGSASYDDEQRSLTAIYSFSDENDWTNHNLGLAASHDYLATT